MICPVCRSDMIVVDYHNIELDYCHSCRGVWFDSGELELLLKSQGLEEPKVFFDGIANSQETASPEKRRNCPICGRKMKKTAIGGQSQILIDACRSNHGLWFDGGEVAQLMKQLAATHSPRDDSKGQVIGFLEELFGASQQTGNN